MENLSWIAEKPLQDKKEEDRVVTQYDKFLLLKEWNERKEEDLRALANRMSAYKTLRKYPLELRVSLLRKAKFVTYKRNVEIIRQGLYMNNVYLLVKGSVTATRTSHNNGKEEKDVTDIREGYLIGEYSLLYEKPSMTTITTQGATQWIVINKHQYVSFAKDELKKRYYDVECALRKFNFFDKLTFFEIREYCIVAEINRVDPHTVLPLSDGTVGLTYFILEGRCSVVQKVSFYRNSDRKLAYPGYKLRPGGRDQDDDVENFIVRTCFLTRRGVFGLGEEACKWVVMTDTECLLMVVPRYMLLKYSRNMVCDRLRDHLTHVYPRTDVIMRHFIENRRWDRYRHRLARALSRNLSGNDIHDVPLLARCSEMISDSEDYIYRRICDKGPCSGLQVSGTRAPARKQAFDYYLSQLAQYLPQEFNMDRKTDK